MDAETLANLIDAEARKVARNVSSFRNDRPEMTESDVAEMISDAFSDLASAIRYGFNQ